MKIEARITFPVGFHSFHKKQFYNFQLNRWHSFGFARMEDMIEAGKNINKYSDWKPVWMKLAGKAESEGRLINAAIYYRSAEFYTMLDDPDRDDLYDKFLELFYKAYAADGIKRFKVPFGDAFLPAIKVPPIGEIRGTIILHGGFDSYIEEFYLMMKYLAEKGYEVIGFEGPGQGGALKKYGLAWNHEWEKPVGAVLDYFGVEDTTLFGLSMGGYLCLRAAAFEPRITRVIANGHAYDYSKIAPGWAQWLMEFFMTKLPNFTNNASLKKIKKGGNEGWQIANTMYITKKDVPMEAFAELMKMNAENMHPERIKQDVLIIAGQDDHFIPIRLLPMQLKALTNAKSVAYRIFKKEEHAGNHCQIGNIGLMLDYVAEWLGKGEGKYNLSAKDAT